MTTMTGSSRGRSRSATLAGPAQHCADRLVKRYGFADTGQARRAYFRHHWKLVNGAGELLYGNAEDGYVFSLNEGGYTFYPVRKRGYCSDIMVTVTYLTADMVFRNMMRC